MSLELDERQRAMLQEMGVRVWSPAPLSARTGELSPEPARQVKAAAAEAAAPGKPVVSERPAAPVGKTVQQTAAPVPTTAQPLPADIAAMDWDALRQAVASCQACGLCESRKNTVFGTGDTQARWLVVGEAPGENEDLQGEPFVGTAGQLLDNMLKAVGLRRDGTGEQGVYIANVLKCRPPANRNPQPDEVAQCEPYLRRQVELQQPQIILALGRFAAQSLLQTTVPDVARIPLGKLRGQVHSYQGVPVVVSYHPAYLLRTPQDKAKAWADLCLALDVMQRGEAASA
ncbi:MAG: uracil-DNA glycosylase [Gammaproteobacteria bacterium]|nr:uracil-DNA glycosylase [Gammaproteobacteria bacterium]MBU0787346.1 uracil-DNA glycosylase [Gammaproteobacteria bacterium]MBU0816086.1 uracil-DNA glycosylase [Gammaproteobacteria bacterium]MBU1787625.1 uracil-DNA glycosylase [Gammaproteobacteria bacterium]